MQADELAKNAMTRHTHGHVSKDAARAAAAGSKAKHPSTTGRAGAACGGAEHVKLASTPTGGAAGAAPLVPPRPWVREYDFSDAIYTPHTVLVLLSVVLSMLVALRYYTYPAMDVVSSVKMGLTAAALVFIAFGAVHLPDSLMVRPHPAVWRAVLACGIIYLVVLTFLLFQDLATVRAIMGYYDSTLRNVLPERAYAADCRMSTEEDPYLFVHTAFDVFIVAHALGYVFKAVMLRDWRMVTCVSLGFELIEVTFQHVLPNFRECWWDHVLLDVLICNAGGTAVGMWLLTLLEAKKYEWTALKEIPTVKGKAQRVLGQFGPRSVEPYHWDVFASPKRFFQVCGILALMFVQELNCFTMKAILNMPPEHHLVAARLALWGLLAMPSMREYYEFMTNPAIERIGTTAWVTTLGLAVETIWIGKMAYEGGYFEEPMPSYIAVPWAVAIVSFALWLCLFFGVLSGEQRRSKRGVAYVLVNALFYVACVAVASVFAMGMPDLQWGRAQFERWIAPHEAALFFWRK